MEDGLTPADMSHKRLVEYFEEAESATVDARRMSERDRDYYDNKQWTANEIAELEKRKQPVVTYNRIQRKVDFMSGLEKQTRKDPKAYPRNPNDDDAAQAATDALRFVCDKEDWDKKRSAAWDNLLIEGTCAVFVGVRQTRNGYDPAIDCISWDRHYGDPKSVRPDWSDARYQGVVTWYDLDEAKAKWPRAGDVLEASMGSSHGTNTGNDETYDDKPKYKTWSDTRNKRVKVCEGYYKERGVWYRAVYTGAGFLEEPQPSPYLDEDGEPECPIKAVSLYVDRDNNRYGMVRVLISPQDEVNKRRSKGLHLITMRQARIAPGAGMEPRDAQKQLTDPNGIIVAERDDFDILPTNDMAAANLQMLQEAKNEIDLLGANAALAGKNENEMSGRAILAQQQGGMVEVARAFDRLRSLSLEVYRAIWNRIRQVWPDERWIRVTDDDRNLKFVGLNQRVTAGMLVEEAAQGDPRAMQQLQALGAGQIIQASMQGDPQAQALVGMFVQQYGQQVVGVRNAVNEVDVDIVIDEGIDTPTVQSEQFDALVKMAPALTSLPPQLAVMLVQASQLRDKDKIIEMLEQAQQVDPMAQQNAQLEMAGKQADVEKTQSETAKNMAQVQGEQARMITDAYRAGAQAA